MAQFWNPAYSCFTFRKVDLVPTVEEYTALLHCQKVSLKDLIVAHPDMKKKVDVFALSIYSLVIFPKALRHIDEAIVDLFERLDKRVTPVPAILAKTFRSLSACRRAGEGRFIGKKTLSGELLGWSPTRSSIGLRVLIGYLCLEFGELLDILLCLF
ncbi:hypothetical protein CXB51_003511 [Gossypium anomalum]|uniref:DUF7745 domain-containing protein n=1 Tax=Gossypium anomalum TaxID=47600 RepID=A0A8J6DAK5_9ROSI|nr:hypothetical protein CXB51_003511 [Gossypium anomalum]